MRWAQQQRIDFIADRLASDGFINRSHLQEKFGISTPQASTDLKLFQRMHPGAMAYNVSARRHERT